MAETTNKTQKEYTTEDVLTAYKNGVGSQDWEEIMAATELSSEALSLRNAIASGDKVLEYQKQISDSYESNIQNIRDKAEYIPRGEHQAFFNEYGYISLKDNGSVSMSTNSVNHFEMDAGGSVSMTNIDTSIKTNSFELDTDDIIINNHKLNNKLYELADWKNVLDTYDGTAKIAGGLTMLGTVLVRAWEPKLQRYVLVRRLINMPVFSPNIGSPEVHPGLKITPDSEFIRKFRKMLNETGINSMSDLQATLQAVRQAAISQQEQETTAKNEEIKKANEAKQAVSMTKLTGQDPATIGASNVAAGTVPQQNNPAGQQMTPTSTPSVAGWDSANNRPNDTEAYWYNVKCKSHKFYVMKGHTVIETWPCNYSSYGTITNKIPGDNKTPLGTFQITSVIKNNMADDVKGKGECKIPGVGGVFGPYYMDISAGNGIAVHGDYPSEDAKGTKCLLNDAPFGKDAVEGQGSTHGCIRLSNADVTTMATKYANMKLGQYIKIEA